ncbi:hypothetical protein GCM10025788_28130 [Serinicoccus chungangensis]
MTEKITSVSSMPKKVKKTASRSEAEQAAVRELVKAARARGEDLTGPDGLLKSITAIVLKTALEEELTEHLGHEKHQAPSADSGNIRNGTRPKTVLTDAAGEVSIAVPRDRAGTFEPVIAQVATTAPVGRGRRRDQPVRERADHRRDERALP